MLTARGEGFPNVCVLQNPLVRVTHELVVFSLEKRSEKGIEL